MLYIGTDQGIYRWFAGAGWPIFHSLQGHSIVGLASPGGGVLVALDTTAKVWESQNNGIEWRTIPLPESAGRPTSLAFVNDSEFVVSTGRPLGLFQRSIGLACETDAPKTFDRARKFEDGLIGRANGLVSRFRGGSSGAVATLKRPTTATHGWTALSLPATASNVRFTNSSHGTTYVAIPGSGLWASGELGKTWNKLPGLPDEVYTIRFAAATMAVGTNDGVKISGDGGQTWADASGGLEKVRQVRSLDIKPGDPKVMLAGCAPFGAGEGPVADRAGLQFALYETKDGGKTWKHVTRGFPEVLESDSIADIRYLPEDPTCAAIALASGEMWNTSSDGLWWEPLARQIRGARILCVTP
jgi:hypothetical protein